MTATDSPPRCDTCRWFVRDEPWPRWLVKSPQDVGECRFNPKMERKFEDDWCSHHDPKVKVDGTITDEDIARIRQLVKEYKITDS